MRAIRKAASGFMAWLLKPRNLLMRDPEYALLSRAIGDAQRKHHPVRGLMEQRQRRVHTLLGAGRAR